MKFALLCCLYFPLMQTSLGREIKKRQLDEFSQEYRAKRGVTYISQPSSVSTNIHTTNNTNALPLKNVQNMNYDIFESPDEVAGGASGPVRIAPILSQPAGSQLPPKFGPVLFPDEEAATQSNGSDQDGKKVQGNQNNQDTKYPTTIATPPQGQGNNGNKNTGESQQRESSSNHGNNSSNRNRNSKSNSPANDRQNGNNSNRNGNNGNGNGNGRGNGRKNCAFPVEMIFCILGR